MNWGAREKASVLVQPAMVCVGFWEPALLNFLAAHRYSKVLGGDQRLRWPEHAAA